MKKLILICVVAFMAATISSCKKTTDDGVKYASYVSGEFIMHDGGISLKSAPDVGGHVFDVYKQVTGGWAMIDGSEFLPGSAPALDWETYTTEGQWWFDKTQPVMITYCPVLPLRVVIKTTTGGQGTAVSYLGIHDFTPNAASFPIAVNNRRLGDVLTMNTDALTALPGYNYLSFTVSYTKSIIDIGETAMKSTNTDNFWPAFEYSSDVAVVNQPVVGSGPVVVYDGLDAKITGTITIKINVDNTTITKTLPASALGHGMAITLKTSAVGWYNSGTIGIKDKDIVMDLVDVDI